MNVRILLPLHVRSDRVAQAMAKVLGEPWRLDNFGTWVTYASDTGPVRMKEPKPFDPDTPCGPDNDWHIRFDRHDQLGPQPLQGAPLDLLYFHIQDAAGQMHRWAYFPESDERSKKIHPEDAAVGLAVGRLLVRFFGGQVQVEEAETRCDCRRLPRQAAFPPPKPDQTDDQRWDQFYNTLRAFPILTSLQLQEAMDVVGPTGSARLLAQRLAAQETQAHLSARLPAVEKIRIARPRV